MITKYNNTQFNKMSLITKNAFKDEIELPNNISNVIYDFLVLSNIFNKDLSFILNDVDSFILFGRSNDDINLTSFINSKLSLLNDKDKDLFLGYIKYVDYNYYKIKKYIKNKDLYMSLFISGKKGSGKSLYNAVLPILKKDYNSIYLWTDETCNYLYYEKNDFIKVEEYDNYLYDKKIRTFIYKKEI